MAINKVRTGTRKRRRLNEALRESEERVRLAAEVGGVGIWEWDLSEDRHVWDETCSKLFYGQPGCCPVSLPAFLDLVHLADRDRVRGEINRAIETCGEFRCEYRVVWPDGSVHDILARGRSVCRPPGHPLNLIGVARDVTEQKQADEALRIVNRRQATSLGGMAKLHEIATRLIRVTRPAELLDEILRAAIELSVAQTGIIQWLDPATGRLAIAAHQGLSPEFLNAFHTVEEGRAACGTALKTKSRIIVEDVTASPVFAGTSLLDVLRAAGIRAMQSTPLLDREGRVVGVLSTHYRARCRPTAYQLRLLDLLARQAADLIERTAAQEALRHSEAILRKTLSAPTVGVLFFSLDGRIQRANETFARMSGYTCQELVNLPHWRVLTAPEFWEATERTAAEIARHGRADPYEKQLVRKDGSRWWGLFAPTPLGGSGGTNECVEFVLEVTDRKGAQEELQAAYNRIETILDSITDAFFALDREGRFTYANAETERQLRKSASELRGGYILDLFPGAEEFLGHYQQALATGQAEHFEAYYAPLEKWFEVHAYPSPDGLSIYFRNVTDRKRAEAALRESEERFRTLADAMPQLAWIANGDGWIYWYNRRWYEYTGTTPEQMEGWGWQSVHDPEVLPQVLERWKASIATGEPFDMEFPLRGADGKFRPFLTRVQPLKDNGGRVVQWFGTNTDIGEQKQAQETLKRFNEELEHRVSERTAQLEAAVEELQRSNEDLEKFAYISSHDLQEPVRMVGIYAGLLAHKYQGQLDEEADRYIGYAVEGAVRISTLIKDLLEYARINAEGRTPAATDTRAVLERVLANLQLTIQETHAQVICNGLPTVWADAAQLTQVFQNLIENAIKYRKDTEPPVIQITAEHKADQWLFKVQDNGIGIDPKFHDQVFVAFKRLHADRSKYPGTGIGLAIVKRIIERHHGRVCIDSRPGEGSAFYFTLPETRQGPRTPEEPHP